jgi:hypothetical protein
VRAVVCAATAARRIALPTTLGSLRRLLLTPSLAEVTFERRGFPVTPTEATRRLEAIPQAVVCGFEWGIDARSQWEVQRRLELVAPEHRGFAYEGVTMAFTVLDAMSPGGRGTRTRELLLGPGRPHIFLTYIGIGFAMARLPRPLWRKVMPDLSGSPYYPTMSWLAVDGYGFDLAYFHTARWVDAKQVPEPYPWDGAPDYFPRAVDQGIGRALWFIHGGQPLAVAAAVGRFAEHRRADLWSGVGLAATFAGGCDSLGYAALREGAGAYSAELAQGSVFATKARVHAGFVPPHTDSAVGILTGLSVSDADVLADVGSNASADGDVPAYEVWRRQVRAHFGVVRTK